MKKRIFGENPYDLETLLESIKIASKNGTELLFLDKIVTSLRSDPYADLTNIAYKALNDLQILKFEPTE